MRSSIGILLWFLTGAVYGQGVIHGRVVNKATEKPVPYAKVVLHTAEPQPFRSDEFGRFRFKDVPAGQCQLTVTSVGYAPHSVQITVQEGENDFTIALRDTLQLQTVDVRATNAFNAGTMRTIEQMTLTHGKKTQRIDVQQLTANKSVNNARELYAAVPGLNIWESDGGGLQLGIGARGLSPDRTAHFNTRQNGCDMSADALGYPETYYTPPAEAVRTIRLIRGAASLQFGPQFGGMLDFDLIRPSEQKISYRGTHTYGGYHLFTTFNTLSGTLKKRFSYLTYYQFKRGDGWRDNSEFAQQHAFAQLNYHFNEKCFVSAEHTFMTYLARQAGGVTDALFAQNPRQSIRERNWFAVRWNLTAARFHWDIASTTQLDARCFKVIARRDALGNLDKISRLDDGLERDLIKGRFNNFGAELRVLHHYPLGNTVKGTLAGGLRYYRGTTDSRQGLANDGKGADFDFLHPDDLEGSEYTFPSLNGAAFVENMWRLSERFWVSAGARFEYIHTEAAGSYREQGFHPLTKELLFDSTYTESKSSTRRILLGGVGATFKIAPQLEVYGNIAQNYRGINFSDIRINNPNQVVDPEMEDEKGFTTDLGWRGKGTRFQYDVSLFFLYYNNKIGWINKKVDAYDFVRFRTNIGSAYSTGVEAFGAYQFRRSQATKNYLSTFLNVALVRARYGRSLEQAYSGNVVELVPPLAVKAGVRLYVGKWEIAYLCSRVHRHYTDGTNAEFDPNAVAGIIPSYYVMDMAFSCRVGRFLRFSGGVNNLTNNAYFTRRASGYPGPGIIPADGINFYTSVGISL